MEFNVCYGEMFDSKFFLRPEINKNGSGLGKIMIYF